MSVFTNPPLVCLVFQAWREQGCFDGGRHQHVGWVGSPVLPLPKHFHVQTSWIEWVCLGKEWQSLEGSCLLWLEGGRKWRWVGWSSLGEEPRWSALEFPPWQVILLWQTHHIVHFKDIKFKNYFSFLFQWKVQRNMKMFVRKRCDVFANGCTTRIVPEGCRRCRRGRTHIVLKGSKIWNLLALLFHCQEMCQSQEMACSTLDQLFTLLK